MSRYHLPACSSAAPHWLNQAHREALDHFMLISELGDRYCVYCANSAQAADHLIPLPVSGPKLRAVVPTVPACTSCNGTLSDFPSPLVVARAAYISMRLRRKHRVRQIEHLEEELARGDRDDFWERAELLSRLHYLDHGGLLRSVRDRWMPPPDPYIKDPFDMAARI